MTRHRQSLLGRLFGRPQVPAGFTGRLEPSERVLAYATLAGGGSLVLTPLGIWVPDDDGVHRVGWELVSKAAWDQQTLVLTESVLHRENVDFVVIADLSPRRFRLTEPGPVPKIVRERVNSSIRSTSRHELPGGGAVFVQRKVPGQDGILLQVRPDPGTDVDAVAAVAAQVGAKIREARDRRRS